MVAKRDRATSSADRCGVTEKIVSGKGKETIVTKFADVGRTSRSGSSSRSVRFVPKADDEVRRIAANIGKLITPNVPGETAIRRAA